MRHSRRYVLAPVELRNQVYQVQAGLGFAQARDDGQRGAGLPAIRKLPEVFGLDPGGVGQRLALRRSECFMQRLKVHGANVSPKVTCCASTLFTSGYRARKGSPYRANMRTIQEIRHNNLLLLLQECGDGRGAAAKLSALTEVPPPIISQLKNLRSHSSGARRQMGDDIARQLERGMGKLEGWMDQDRGVAKNASEALLIDLSRLLTADQTQLVITMAEQLAEGNARSPRAPSEPRPPRNPKRLN